MSCLQCHCVAIPDSNPQICPECFMKKHEQMHYANVGIDEQVSALTEEEVMTLYPSVSSIELEAFTFYISDFDDLVKVDKSNGTPYVFIETEQGQSWHTWGEYLQSLI